jgi:hypothetical protein
MGIKTGDIWKTNIIETEKNSYYSYFNAALCFESLMTLLNQAVGSHKKPPKFNCYFKVKEDVFLSSLGS